MLVRIVSAAALLAAMVCGGCAKQGAFEPCPMTDSMKTDCDQTLDGLLGLTPCDIEPGQSSPSIECHAACTVLKHPQCPDGVCTIYQYRPVGVQTPVSSDAFCTMTCDPSSKGHTCAADGKPCSPDMWLCNNGKACNPRSPQCPDGTACVAGTICADPAKTPCAICSDSSDCLPRCGDSHSECVSHTCPDSSVCLSFLGQGLCIPVKYFNPR